MSGKVYLIGAGPGDPELLTRRAWRLIQSADAVLHDELVSPEILAFVPPFARVFSVGKRCRRRAVTQKEINTLMVACALSGLTVVRLKGGDPLIFGRIGEEIDALREAEVEFEIVPGITAACAAAAAARIPLTDRRFASELVFVPGHLASGKSAQAAWERLSPNATVVVYMPGADYARVSAQLVEAGLNPETPCLIVSCASMPEEQRLLTTLEGLPEVSAGPSPSLLIVGAVAALGSGAPGKSVHNAFIGSFNVGQGWGDVRRTPGHRKEKGMPCLLAGD